nr:ISKra4 family transposase [Gammaproteobacteria bacterium]
LRYHEYLAAGLPIATGVIEGACRHLIKDRMDITGARWGLESAEAILKLRSLRSSGDFEAYWAFHTTQELKRNHTSRYECLPLQKAA